MIMPNCLIWARKGGRARSKSASQYNSKSRRAERVLTVSSSDHLFNSMSFEFQRVSYCNKESRKKVFCRKYPKQSLTPPHRYWGIEL